MSKRINLNDMKVSPRVLAALEYRKTIESQPCEVGTVSEILIKHVAAFQIRNDTEIEERSHFTEETNSLNSSDNSNGCILTQNSSQLSPAA